MGGVEIGSIIDRRYRLKREIARGGGGVVYEAEHVFTKRAVALKLLTPDAVRESRERLLREAHALGITRHPGIVTAFDAGETSDGSPYLVMELLEGRTLDGILAVRGRIPVHDAVSIGQQAAAALAAAHEQGILHRDIKPGNMFIARDDEGREVTKLFDFGIANLAVASRKITQNGAILGTPEYMAPEQLLSRDDIDHRCDIYALGVTLYECLTGAVPFEGNFGEVLLKSSTTAVRPLRERCPEASADLAMVIEMALAREPDRRFQSARALRQALHQVLPSAQSSSLLGLALSHVSPAEASAGALALIPEKRRRFPRAPYVTIVSIKRQDGTVLDARSEDVSVGGMLVLPKEACEQTEIVTVGFALPMTGVLVQIVATSRWIKSARHRHAVGLEFSAVPPEAYTAIERYVQAMGAEET